MRPLHVRILVRDPARDDVQAVAEALRAGGHLVSTITGGATSAPDFVLSDAAALPVPESLEAAEARHIAAVLAHTRGNRRQAALLLGVARSTLLAKIRRYGL